jgi:hypothetical protein
MSQACGSPYASQCCFTDTYILGVTATQPPLSGLRYPASALQPLQLAKRHLYIAMSSSYSPFLLLPILLRTPPHLSVKFRLPTLHKALQLKLRHLSTHLYPDITRLVFHRLRTLAFAANDLYSALHLTESF